MYSYELYVCAGQLGCLTWKRFEAANDKDAASLANKEIDDHENSTGDYVYRERLYRNTQSGEQVEIAI